MVLNPNLPWHGCELLKIDVEGFEVEVLAGAKRFIRTFNPTFIQLEYNLHHMYWSHNFIKIASMILNYTAFRLLPHEAGMVFYDPTQFSSNIFQYANYVFVRDSALEELPRIWSFSNWWSFLWYSRWIQCSPNSDLIQILRLSNRVLLMIRKIAQWAQVRFRLNNNIGKF